MALLRSSVFGSPGRETPKDRTRGDDFAEGVPRMERDDEKLRCVIEWISYLTNFVPRVNSYLEVYILIFFFCIVCIIYFFYNLYYIESCFSRVIFVLNIVYYLCVD